MSRGKLWSVKGISPEAREAARLAAQQQGQPIGTWIDQIVRMSDDKPTDGSEGDGLPPAEPTNEEIVRVLEALEARVARHADHISGQIEPLRERIAALDARLGQIEHSGQSDVPPMPSAPQDPPQSRSEPGAGDLAPPPASPAPLSPPGRSQDDFLNGAETRAQSGEHPSPTVNETAPDAANTSEPDSPVERPAIADAENLSEADIRAADASLKSELKGLFDDNPGSTHPQASQPPVPITAPLERPGYDRYPPRPPRRHSSAAPLLFIVLLLLVAGGAVAMFAWYGLGSSQTREPFSFDRIVNYVTSRLSPDEPDDTDPKSGTADQPPEASPPQPPAPPPASDREAPPPASGADGPPITPQSDLRAPETSAAGAPTDPELVRLLDEAERGNAAAQNELGVRYLVGRGVPQDYGQAARWLQAAAAQDMTNAQYNLGVLYDSGRGVEADPTRALFWFHNAAENGHGRAQMAMAGAYATGRGIERNSEEAVKWLRRAAESNIADAQFSLANILSGTPETRKSLVDALFWYRVADANGIAEAGARADQLASGLNAEERASVNRRVSDFIGTNIAPANPAGETQPPARAEENDAPDPAPSETGEDAAIAEPNVSSADAENTADAGAPEAAPAEAGTAEVREPAQDPLPAPPPATSVEIRRIQELLTRLGFDPGPADGAMGARTRSAIETYQRELGLPVTGEASPELLQNLREVAGG